jgi:hypothetical protein
MAPLYSGTRVPVNGLKGVTKNSAMAYHGLPWLMLQMRRTRMRRRSRTASNRIPAVIDNATWESEMLEHEPDKPRGSGADRMARCLVHGAAAQADMFVMAVAAKPVRGNEDGSARRANDELHR